MGLPKRKKRSNARTGSPLADAARKPRQPSDGPARNPTRKLLLIATVAVFVVTRLWWLSYFGGIETGGSGYFALRVHRAIDQGAVVYRDFDLEYPPVAWWLMATPRVIDPNRGAPTQSPTQAVRWYFRWYRIELFLADVACFCLLLAIGRRVSRAAELPAAGGVRIDHRGAAAIHVRQPRNRAVAVFPTLDLLLAAIAGAGIFDPLGLGQLSVSRLRNQLQDPTARLCSLSAVGRSARWAVPRGWPVRCSLVTAAAGPFLVYIPSAGWGVFKLFQYHSERGVNLESTLGKPDPGSIAVGVSLPGDRIARLLRPGRRGAGPLKIISHVAPLLAAGLLGLWAVLRGSRFDRRLAVDTAILALVTTTVLSHVYSCYYTNWLLPLATLLAFSVLPPGWILWSLFAAASVLILAISSWMWPWHYTSGLARLQDLPVALCILRSACLAGLALLLTLSFFGKYRGTATQKT